jgi:hypothetical protein
LCFAIGKSRNIAIKNPQTITNGGHSISRIAMVSEHKCDFKQAEVLRVSADHA